jgi:prepilin-type processing-associated H-X9-DG protein
MGIIALLLAIMTPVLRYTIGYARGFRCKMALRNTAFDFRIFADNRFFGNRGDDTQLPGQRFRLETFLDAEYGIDEFWAYGQDSVASFEDTVAYEMMQCPEVHTASSITLHKGASCSGGGVQPASAVSYGFNRNLHQTEIVDSRGRPRVVPAFLRGDALLQTPGIPLGMDVDAEAAAARGVSPFFTAPDLSLGKSQKGGKYWFPALRHNGQANVSFIDGHVASTADPMGPAEWRWDYEPAQ